MKSTNKLKFTSLLILLLFVVFFTLTACEKSLSGVLSIHMIDVGQGESILIITPNNKTILIDAGEQSEGRRVKAYLTKNRINKIDLIIGTHPHSDHIGGLSEIIKNFEVEKIIMPKKLHTSATFEKLLTTIESKGLTISTPQQNKLVEFDENIKLHFLGPIKDYGDNLNLWSIVFRLDYMDKSFLFTGDIEEEAEIDLINTYDKAVLRANVLNVGHHGSNTSTSKQFLDYVNPEIALISLGNDNPYGHPHREVIKRLEEASAFIYRTDLQGTVILLSDGIEIWSNQVPSNKKDSFQKLP
ncbi:ComEC/Rec2 family competence protein [Alkaliphilus sp. B6464]|uniref:ComEC/Rec2 family competence protein n=1 Tax=Alkaliphilus sp. B6464 TaxID=2731219 RepID=UPI001BA9BEB7|nr:ComEC/Rec2 family competence protein [Alkaliphilus sp. B6464]QUH21133.1 MBL fold metallo-hydrolase [Alkaliphilus sp. B6464]